MLLAIIPQSSYAETLLNNLAEADFDLADVSVVMRDPKQRDAIANDAGPLKGTTMAGLARKLTQLGVTKPEAQSFVDAVGQGQVLIAIAVPKKSEPAALEMLKDHSATLTKAIP